MSTRMDALQLLVQLQQVDSALDALQEKQGSLPTEIEKLTERIAVLLDQVLAEKALIKNYEEQLVEEQQNSKKVQELIKQYQEQTTDNLTPAAHEELAKAIALQELEVQLFKKKIRSIQQEILVKKNHIQAIKDQVNENKAILQAYKERLKTIKQESKTQQTELEEQRQAIVEKLQESDLLPIYQKLRTRMNLVVTKVVDEACNGCFMFVPLQRQIDIRTSKKVIFCENCARILASIEKTAVPATQP